MSTLLTISFSIFSKGKKLLKNLFKLNVTGEKFLNSCKSESYFRVSFKVLRKLKKKIKKKTFLNVNPSSFGKKKNRYKFSTKKEENKNIFLKIKVRICTKLPYAFYTN